MFKPAISTNAFTSRLLSNKGALFGMLIIITAFFMAVFAYFIAPDNSPYANRIIPEIANREAGFTIHLVQVKKDLPGNDQVNFFEKLINGQRDIYSFIPVTTFKQTADSIIARKFIDDGITEKFSLPLTALAPSPVVQQKFLLGTDKFGRDIASRLIVGTRVSLSVGFIAVAISLTIGLVMGALAGYFKGMTDNVIMWFINVVWSIPTLLLVFAVTLLLGKGFWQVFIAVGLTMWVNVARLVRGQVLAVRELEYVEAAKALGFSHMRIIVLHILPNIMGPVLVIAASNFASAIVIEAGLSFLGVGVQPPQPSWGLMIKENYNFIITNNPMLALEPGIAIMLLVLAFNLVGNGLRDALNVREL
ncbi:ABC transporter permease [Panacibacter sp. DH6]|uniref:ABC transporter permease n=2 Tax=Panacibacter microcysteis TaxID=2793269 RepID=A0A931E5Q7_9BACT|nr:ABC transporter permease [Panacibacter microcysteis]